MKRTMVLMGLVACSALSGCADTLPRAWQRGQLAEPIMAWEPDAPAATLRERNYQGKEASSGGAVVSGGGCGCN